MEVVGELGRGGDLAGSSGSTASAAWLSGIDVDSFSSAMAPPGSPLLEAPRGAGGMKQMRVWRRFGLGAAAFGWRRVAASKAVGGGVRKGRGNEPGPRTETSRRRQPWRGGVTNLPLGVHH